MKLVDAPLSEARVPRRRAEILAPFRYRDFRLLWSGLLVSNLGTWMQFTTIGYLVVNIAHGASQAALNVGLLGASAAIPALVFSPLAGVVADRYPRREVLFITNTAISLIAFALAALVGFHRESLWSVLALNALRSAAGSFDSPARQSWVPMLVPRENVGNAIGLNSIAFNGPSVLGPPLAGAFILGIGMWASFLVNAVSTLAVVIALAFMAPVGPSTVKREPVAAAIVSGLRFLFRHPVLSSVVWVLVFSCLLVRPYVTMLPAYAAHVVHVDARGLGILLAFAGVGAIFGSVVTAVVGSRRRAMVWFASAVVMSLGTIALGLTHSFLVALPALFFTGMATLSFAGSTNVLMQTLAPDEMRGRAISVFTMIILGLVPLGSLLLGVIASVLGLGATVGGAGAISLLGVVAMFAGNRALRRV